MTELEQAAMAYGAAQAAYQSALSCNAPAVVVFAMKRDLEFAEIELNEAALTFYNNHFDGAE